MGVRWVWRGGEVGWYRFLTVFFGRFSLLGVQACSGKEIHETVSSLCCGHAVSWLDTLVSITSTATVSGLEILESGFFGLSSSLFVRLKERRKDGDQGIPMKGERFPKLTLTCKEQGQHDEIPGR